jgi:demethylmenaquinone methyltransferase/2-methoxy-6-polyprenyl-1,4-benzoquinol methylase
LAGVAGLAHESHNQAMQSSEGMQISGWDDFSRANASRRWRKQSAVMGSHVTEAIVDEAQIQPGLQVLDVACGNGALLWNLFEKERIECYGIDISEDMISAARNKYPHFTFKVANSDCLPFEDHKFDVITVSAAFHHFTQPEKFIMEARRVLKDGGKLYIAEVYAPPLLRQAENLILPFMKMGDVKIYSKKELIKFGENAGFKEVSVVRVERVNLFIGKA